MRTLTNTKGLVLVAVLWVAVVLVLIAFTLGRNSLLDSRISLVRTEMVRCKWACRAGLETAIGVLKDDLKTSDSLTDLWSENDQDFNNVELERCLFTVRVIDEAGKLNVNSATKEQLLGLPYMTEEIADAIIDWRDEDETPGATGAEGGYYENLRYRYRIRNGPFRTIRELLQVKGITAELLYGEDTNLNGSLDYNEKDGDQSPPPDDSDDELDKGWIAYLTCHAYDNNKDAYGNARVNINEADEGQLEESLELKKSYAKWIVENRPGDKYKSIADLINERSPDKPEKKSGDDSEQAQPLDLETFTAIADKITVKDDGRILGRININTAPREVLAALLGADQAGEQAADDIVAYRRGVIGGMESIAEIMKVNSIKVPVFKKIAEDITTRSEVFTVRCFAVANRAGYAGATLQAETVVDRGPESCRILYSYQGASN
ncbi:MAG: type II secretion system minor pseudopilin [Planctomycetota bacterium]|jgi:type II secretory pathway component PulK